jgi:hypothetical protein
MRQRLPSREKFRGLQQEIRTDGLGNPSYAVVGVALLLAMANLRAHAALLLPQFPPTLARFLDSHSDLLEDGRQSRHNVASRRSNVASASLT